MITGNGKVLIFEDSVNNALDWKRELAQRGYEPQYFSSFETGIHEIVQNWPDVVVISDLLGPVSETFRYSGVGRLCSELYRLSVAFHLPLPALVGTSRPRGPNHRKGQVFHGISSEVMPIILQKPIKPGMMADTVDSLLGRVFADECARAAISLVARNEYEHLG